MENKCQKFEGLFVFSDEETLQEHIKECPECAAEAKKMQRIAEILQEVRPYFIKKRKHYATLKIACAITFIILSGTVLGITNFNQDVNDMIRVLENVNEDVEKYFQTYNNAINDCELK